MNRRTFFSWIGVGWLASTSPVLIGAVITKFKHQPEPASNYLSSSLRHFLFYVSPNGNDTWSGKREIPNTDRTDGPFATIQRARDAIRQIKRLHNGTLKKPVTVLLRDGSYFLPEPLTFTPEDSGKADCPITYKAYPGEKPIISGGQLITDWQRQGNLWVTHLPNVKTGKWYFRLLRVGDDWAIRARYPKFDFKNPLTGGWLFAQWQGKPSERGTFGAGVSRVGNPGDKLEWKIVIPGASNYKVWVRYAHNMKAYGIDKMDGRTVVRLGNTNQIPLVNLPDTGSWGNYSWSSVATIYIPAGEQTLIWENIQGGGINLDAIYLTDDPNWNPETAIKFISLDGRYELQTPTEGKHLIPIQAEACTKAIAKESEVSNPASVQQAIYNRLVIESQQFPNWQNWEGAELHIFPAWGWVNAILPLTSVDKESKTLHFNCDQDIRPGNRFYIANVREALTSPGEWYLDKKSGELFYWAINKDFPKSVPVIAPTMDRVFVLQGNMPNGTFVEYITFEGLTFTDTDYTLTDNYYVPADAAIWMTTAQQCMVKNCTFVNLGGYGIKIEERSQNNLIIGNKMKNLGQGGVVLLGNSTNQPVNNLIAANDIQDCGQIYKHVAGVFNTCGSENRIAHNRVCRMPRYGIYLNSYSTDIYSRNNIVEFNEIVDTNLETNDTSAIGTLGRDRQLSGNIIRFNYIRNVVGMGTKDNGQIVSPYYTWGIYLDDYSSGTTVYGNIVVSTMLGGIMIHGGKDNLVENNILIDGVEQQIQLTPHGDDPQFMGNNVIRRNIVVYKEPKAKLLSSETNTWRSTILAECDYNLYWHKDSLDLAKTEQAITPAGNFSQWQAFGFDRNSFITDPLFFSSEMIDIRLKPNSPAYRLGFQPIPIERIGIKGFNLNNKEE
jgi:parallel beta-helix repeat protein